MRIFLLSFLVILLIFRCGNKKDVLLSERLELIYGTEEHNNYQLINNNKHLYNKLNPTDKAKLFIIKKHVAGITSYLQILKDEMIEGSGGVNPETMMLMNKNDFVFPYHFITNSDYRRTFKDTLDIVPKLITELGLFDAPTVVLDANADPYWSLLPETKRKSAFQLLFEGTNLPGALTTITQLENRILYYENKAYQIVLLHELDSLRAN
jgi:hypothetical protein